MSEFTQFLRIHMSWQLDMEFATPQEYFRFNFSMTLAILAILLLSEIEVDNSCLHVGTNPTVLV